MRAAFVIGSVLFLFAGTVALAAPEPAKPAAADTTGTKSGEGRPDSGPPLDPSSGATPDLGELTRIVQEQQKLLEKQGKEMAALRDSLAQVRLFALSLSNRLNELRDQPADTSFSAAIEKRLSELEQSTKKTPELPTAKVSAADFPGSFPIPGTDAAIRIGGRVRTTMVYTIDALGTDDRFVTSSIPVEGSEEAGKGPRTTFSARPSRLNVDFRSPTKVGSMRAYIEGDFAGSGNTFRLRHAFGQWRKFVIGQTWSTFSDPEAEPDGIDFEGLNAISLFRQVEIRWTQQLSENTNMSFSVENPDPSVTGAAGVSVMPDVIGRIRWEPKGRAKGHILLETLGHTQACILIRTITAEPVDRPNQTVTVGGFGGNWSGALAPHWDRKAKIKFAVYGGTGIGRYIQDLAALGGQDAVYDSTTNTLEALTVIAAYMGYERKWSPVVRSTVTYGYVVVENLDIQTQDSLHHTNRATANAIWSPVQRIDIVLEFLIGLRANKDHQRGTASQIQSGVTFRF